MKPYSTSRITLISAIGLFAVRVSCASASNLYVATNGNDANTCHTPGDPCLTIQAAVNKSADGDAINVAAGNYPGAISIFQRKNLTVAGSSGASISDPGLPLGSAVITVEQSKNIAFQDLTISGNPSGVEAVRIFSGEAIEITRDVIQNASLGFFINQLSSVNISDSIIQQNSSIGVRVDGGSHVVLNSAPFSGGTTIVQGSPQGVFLRSGVLRIHGATVIQNNDVGIIGESGEIKSCCEDGDVRKIINNGTGIQTRDVNVFLRGPLLMEGNTSFAIRQFSGMIRLQDRVNIRGNGASGGAAVFVTAGHLQLTGSQAGDIQIANNPGIGVLLTDNASSRVLNTSITNNGGNGMRVQALSVATLLDNTVMRDNSGKDLSCTPNSFGRGSDAGVQKMFCPGFDKSPDPGGP